MVRYPRRAVSALVTRIVDGGFAVCLAVLTQNLVDRRLGVARFFCNSDSNGHYGPCLRFSLPFWAGLMEVITLLAIKEGSACVTIFFVVTPGWRCRWGRTCLVVIMVVPPLFGCEDSFAQGAHPPPSDSSDSWSEMSVPSSTTISVSSAFDSDRSVVSKVTISRFLQGSLSVSSRRDVLYCHPYIVDYLTASR